MQNSKFLSATIFIVLFTTIISLLVYTVGVQEKALYWERFSLDLLPTELSVGGIDIEEGTSILKTNLNSLLFPIATGDYSFTSPFGKRFHPIIKKWGSHKGLDIVSVWKAQVVAVADGVVIENWPPPGKKFKGHPEYGGMVLIEHSNGIVTRYAHLSVVFTLQGRRVKAGEVIGRVGSTGISTGAHLHFEIILNGELVNPLLYYTDLDSLNNS